MGSGLILLVIVGAWLAVLVPMGLRSHDSATASRSTERFSEAMRVLARRSVAEPEEVVDEHEHDEHPRRASEVLAGLGARASDAGRGLRAGVEGLARSARSARGSLPSRASATGAPVRTAAERRRRVLVLLVAGTAACLLLGLVGPGLLLLVGLVGLVATGLFLASCRRSVARSAAEARLTADRRRAEERRAAEAAAVRIVPSRVAAARPAPSRVPAQATTSPVVEQVFDLEQGAPLTVAPAPAARVARGAYGAEWQPVPVPVPLYVGATAAPTRPVRTPRVDAWSAEVPAAEPAADHAPERRRASGDW